MYSPNHRVPQLTGLAFASIDCLLDICVSRAFSFAYSNKICNREWGTIACRRWLRCWRDPGIRLYVHGPLWSIDHGRSLSTLEPRSAQGRHGQRPMSKQKSENYIINGSVRICFRLFRPARQARGIRMSRTFTQYIW